MSVIVAGVIVLSIASMRLTRYLGIEKWRVQLGLLGLAVLLYIVSVWLTHQYITRGAPELTSTEEVFPDVQAWELTAGLGIVPKWVSMVGLLSYSAAIAAIMPWILEMLFYPS